MRSVLTPGAVRPPAHTTATALSAAQWGRTPSVVRAGRLAPVRWCARGGLLLEVLVACAALAFASQALLLTQLRSLTHQHSAVSRWQAQVLTTEWLERLSLQGGTLTSPGGAASGWTPLDAPQACDVQACDRATLLRWQQAEWQRWAHWQLPQGAAGLWLGESPAVALGIVLRWHDPVADAPTRAALNPSALAAGTAMACPDAQQCAVHWRAP